MSERSGSVFLDTNEKDKEYALKKAFQHAFFMLICLYIGYKHVHMDSGNIKIDQISIFIGSIIFTEGLFSIFRLSMLIPLSIGWRLTKRPFEEIYEEMFFPVTIGFFGLGVVFLSVGLENLLRASYSPYSTIASKMALESVIYISGMLCTIFMEMTIAWGKINCDE